MANNANWHAWGSDVYHRPDPETDCPEVEIKNPEERLKEILAAGVRMGLVYEEGAYWQVGFMVGPDGKQVRCFRAKVEWLLPE